MRLKRAGRRRRLVGLQLIWLSLSSCINLGAYELLGEQVGLTQYSPWAILTFYETPSTALSTPLAQALSRLLAAEGIVLTARPTQARVLLDGDIHVTTLPSASRAGIQAYALQAQIDLRLRHADGSLLWQGSSQAQEDFLPDATPDAQPLTTETQRRFAIHRLAERAAAAVHETLLMNLQPAT